MKAELKEREIDAIAKALGGKRRGKVNAKGGHFGALGLVADVQARFRTPKSGGRATNPEWTEKRLVSLAPETLRHLELIASKMRKGGVRLDPMQLAALLIEKKLQEFTDEDAEKLLRVG